MAFRSPDPDFGKVTDGIPPAPLCSGTGEPEPPAPVTHALQARGLANASTIYEPLRGGRSNHLWKFASNGRNLVCKLYTNRTTPLFPNDPNAEQLALKHVSGKGLGPEPVMTVNAGNRIALIYEFIEGQRWQRNATAVGALLARLHAVPPPSGLRRIPAGGREIVGSGQRMLSDYDGPDVQRLLILQPEPPDVPAAPLAFLHGDVVPENLVDGPHGLRLIDWQCPAIGDPTEDLAMFLSPAMQTLYGGAPLAEASRTRFLDALGNPIIAERYHALAPAFHWRMAAYCLWQSMQGEADYLIGFSLECDLLEELNQPDPR